MSTNKFMFRQGKNAGLKSWEHYTGEGYFVNIYAKGEEQFFGCLKNSEMDLSPLGKFLEITLKGLHERFPFVQIPIFVIMPDHVNMILMIHSDSKTATKCTENDAAIESENPNSRITINELANRCVLLSTAVNGVKSSIRHFAQAKGINFEWQNGYHNRLIHDADEFFRVAIFMENHPGKFKKESF